MITFLAWMLDPSWLNEIAIKLHNLFIRKIAEWLNSNQESGKLGSFVDGINFIFDVPLSLIFGDFKTFLNLRGIKVIAS